MPIGWLAINDSHSYQTERDIMLLRKKYLITSNIRNLIPANLKRQLYFSLVFPHIQYGIEIYGACSKNLIEKVQILQNKLLKVLYEKPYRTDTNLLHTETNILKVIDIRKINILKFVYMSINKTSIKQFHNHYTFHRNIHNRNSRQSNRLYLDGTPNTKYGESTLHYAGTKLWNSLEDDTRKCPSLYTFKRAIRLSCIARYN